MCGTTEATWVVAPPGVTLPYLDRRDVAVQHALGNAQRTVEAGAVHHVMAPDQVASIYAGRWSIEDTFRNTKQLLGGEDPQSWKCQGPERGAAAHIGTEPVTRGAKVHSRAA